MATPLRVFHQTPQLKKLLVSSKNEAKVCCCVVHVGAELSDQRRVLGPSSRLIIERNSGGRSTLEHRKPELVQAKCNRFSIFRWFSSKVLLIAVLHPLNRNLSLYLCENLLLARPQPTGNTSFKRPLDWRNSQFQQYPTTDQAPYSNNTDPNFFSNQTLWVMALHNSLC